MKRLFFLIPDLKVAHEVVVDLEQMGITEKRIHVIGGSPELLKQAHVLPATSFHTNVQPVIKWALLAGFCFSILIFAAFAIALPSSVKLHGLALLAVVVFGMGFGIWAVGMISLIKIPVLDKYESYIKEGHFIMMVDAPEDRVKDLTEHVIHHQGTQIAETSSTHH